MGSTTIQLLTSSLLVFSSVWTTISHASFNQPFPSTVDGHNTNTARRYDQLTFFNADPRHSQVVCVSISLSVTLCIVALRVDVVTCTVVFLEGHFLFTYSATFAVGCIV